MTRLPIFISLLLSSFLSTYAYSSEETLCKADEIMIASCQIDEKKSRNLSICSDSDKEKIIYRFGRKNNIEMSVIFSRENRLSRWLDIGTYTTYFGFRKGDYGYSFGVPQQTYGAKAFLDITWKDRLIQNHDCVGNSFGETNLLSAAVLDVPDGSIRDNNFLFPPKLDVEY